jgi:lipopolysaccharide heptosyltransferase II
MTIFKNILIVRTDRMGDVILTTPAIRALRKNLPNARLTALVSPATRELLDGNPYLDEVLVDDRKNVNRGPLGFFKLAGLLRAKRFDLAIIFHTKKRTNALCFFAGIPQRLGYRNNKYGFLLTKKVFDDRSLGIKHEAEYCLDLLKTIGIEERKLELFIPIRKEAEAWAERFWDENHLRSCRCVVAVNPGASSPTRQWPAKRFAEVIDDLVTRYSSRTILIGGQDNAKAARDVLAAVHSPVLDLTGKLSLGQLTSLLKRCQLLVSNITGPAHVAAGVGTAVVALFTRNQPGVNPTRWRPLGERSRVVVTPFQENVSLTEEEAAESNYLELIKTEDVLKAVDSILNPK